MSSTLVKLSGKLKQHTIVYNAVEKCKTVIKAIVRYDLLKLSTQVTEVVGCIVYTDIPARYKIDKNQLIVDILTDVYQLTDPEKVTLTAQIEDLVDRKIIKPDSSYKYVENFVVSFFSKKTE